MSLPAASFEPVISYLNLASPGAEIRSGKIGNSASLRRSGHTTTPAPDQGKQVHLKLDILGICGHIYTNFLFENKDLCLISFIVKFMKQDYNHTFVIRSVSNLS